MIILRDKLFNVVCNIRTTQSNGNIIVGTGTFISYQNDVYLLTAHHVSNSVNAHTLLVFGQSNDIPLTISFSELTQGNNWKSHSVADMAIIKLNIINHQSLFIERCFPFDHINLSCKCASRDDQLTVIGFPNGLGVQGKFSPLTYRSYPASSFLTLSRADTKTPSDFFCMENPSVGGYSGGPVFDLGYEKIGCAMTTKEMTQMHGIIHGTMSDNTGGKIALVTPMYYLIDLI